MRLRAALPTDPWARAKASWRIGVPMMTDEKQVPAPRIALIYFRQPCLRAHTRATRAAATEPGAAAA